MASKGLRKRFSLPRKASSVTPKSVAPSISNRPSISRINSCTLKELREVFHKFDANNDGKISAEELRTILRSFGYNATDAEIAKMMTAADSDGDGFINFDEFLAVNTKGLSEARSMEDMEKAFGMFDLNKNGSISAEELFMVLRGLGETATMDECRRMIKSVDSNSDGLVSLEEFKTMMMANLA